MTVSVGVVIAARNPGPLLVEALGSVARQTHRAHEVVLVDDGSTDGAPAEAARTYPWLHLVHQPPTGAAAARNLGAREATAETLVFLDADDLLCPGALGALVGVLATDPNVDMAHGLVSEFADPANPPPPSSRAPDERARVRLGGATLVRRTLWDRVGPLDETLPQGEWIDWIHRAGRAGAVVAEIDEVVLRRRLHGGNLTGDGDADAARAYLTMAHRALRRGRPATGPNHTNSIGRPAPTDAHATERPDPTVGTVADPMSPAPGAAGADR